MSAYAVGDRVTVVEHDPETRLPKLAPRTYLATVKRLSTGMWDYVTVECDENRAQMSFYRDSGWNTGWDNGYRWRVQPACRVCRGTGAVTVPDPGGESTHETACTEPGCTAPSPFVAADLAGTGEGPY